MRKLTLAICDYNNNIICDLYDNRADVSGQAYDVHLITERNGWKELNFTVPSTCHNDEGEEKNYRLQYLIADYKIRFEDDYGVDWFIISGPKIMHKAFSQDISVTADHISMRLKMKNLDLEFSDEEGNNVGTALEILTTILDGTGWAPGEVCTFYEDDGVTEKVRSMKASAKTGAFKMITDMCDLFEAKPIFHGDERTVDIFPMNPFAREITIVDGHMSAGKPLNLEAGQIPPIVQQGCNVLEINYNYNARGISRALNTENMVTKLYAYGSYGDTTDGLCSLQKVTHYEYTFNVETPNVEYKFYDIDQVVHYFTAGEAGEYIWSDMDPASRTYVWHDKAYHVTDKPTSEPIVLDNVEPEAVENHFSYLMDFDYFEEVGLFTEEMFQKVASFQRDMPAYLIQAEEASKSYTEKEEELSTVAESMTGLARLDVASYTHGENNALCVHLNKSTYDEGVIYRTDYDEARRNRFTWHVVNQLKENGDPYSGVGSVLFIIHDTDPVTWEMAYLHQIDERYHYETEAGVEKKVCDDYVYGISEGEPEYFTVWADYREIPSLQPTDRFYLLCTKSMTGYLGAKQVEDESAVQTLASSTKTVTENHPTYFEKNSGSPTTPITAIQNSYGWCYLYNPTSTDIGRLYFCYGYLGDSGWKNAYCQMEEPQNPFNGDYFLNTKTKEFFHRENGEWVLWDSVEDKRIANQFSKVNYYCLRRDMLYKGLYEKYTYNGTLAEVGNYAFKTQFGFYWVFTTDKENTVNPYIDTTTYCLYQTDNVADVVSVDTKPFDTVEYPKENILANINFNTGTIDSQGVEQDDRNSKRTGNISIYELTDYEYNLPSGSKIYVYNQHKNMIQSVVSSGHGIFKSAKHAYFLRVASPTVPTSGQYIHVYNYDHLIYVNDKLYTVLDNVTGSGILKGINYLTKQFADLTDEAYLTYLPALLAAQKVVNDKNKELSTLLGDIYREGWWQNPDYVEGDEAKLYKDAIDNLKEIAKPEASYDIDFIDLHEIQNWSFYVEDDNGIKWPDVQATDAVHLIDEEIKVNLWAYIDKVNKCYDKPWETSIAINTNLSSIGQHSFTDVMSRIADIANQTKARQQIYERAAAITPFGTILAERLEGTIQTNANAINGGATNWYTDEQGSLVFESADGMSAMKLTGSGFGLASSKNADGEWEWRLTAVGTGLTADAITTGTLSARLIEAGTITVDKLHSSVGQDLEIGSNTALQLFATIDGERPAGALLTTDALISIKAGDGTNPAAIDILSGGTINMRANSDFTMQAGGNFSIESGADISIRSSNFNIYKIDGEYHVDITGSIDAESGSIGGWDINETSLSSGTGSNHVELSTDGTYAIFAGAASGANAPFWIKPNGEIHATSGSFSGTINGGSININDRFIVDQYGAVTAKSVNITGGTISMGSGASTFGVTAGGYMSASNVGITGGAITGTSININNNFIVDSEGNLTAKTGTFEGELEGATGTFAGVIKVGDTEIGAATTVSAEAKYAIIAGGANDYISFRINNGITSGTASIIKDLLGTGIAFQASRIHSASIYGADGLTLSVGGNYAKDKVFIESMGSSTSIYYAAGFDFIGGEYVSYEHGVSYAGNTVKLSTTVLNCGTIDGADLVKCADVSATNVYSSSMWAQNLYALKIELYGNEMKVVNATMENNVVTITTLDGSFSFVATPPETT